MFSLSTIRAMSRGFVGRSSGHFVVAQWNNLTWPPVSLHEWQNQQRELGRSARSERDTGAILRGIAGKRSLIERAKRLTHDASKKHLPQPKKAVDDFQGLELLKGRSNPQSTPVPGEE